ncbi:MAG TPA: DedA family protein [Candidatus Binataceae bacterium]|nr:DedA family protein [Candidatus Binataceae bacterium]
MYKLLAALSAFAIGVISTMGYAGVILLMAVESACIPVPSEVIMPFSGYLVASGRFHLQLVALAGAFGCLLGSYVAYAVGASGGRWALERWGRFILITHHELEIADRFFDRFGPGAIFIGRLLPMVRTFIAFPAGVARMRLLPFSIYTLAGSYIWCLVLAWFGMKLGQHWESIGPYFRRFDNLVVALIAIAIVVAIYGRLRGGSPAVLESAGASMKDRRHVR